MCRRGCVLTALSVIHSSHPLPSGCLAQAARANQTYGRCGHRTGRPALRTTVRACTFCTDSLSFAWYNYEEALAVIICLSSPRDPAVFCCLILGKVKVFIAPGIGLRSIQCSFY